ncbi:uncharacterized protein F5147DRAFT_242924 [Suillus discolor]|uniref:Uncharacterized protein n=1 Tax=Suillus discolor TaxID=1912936 RepID=A0A9P7JSM3_9AGAM|nr:uncharacterized protein F5147DRAFT_242924 [Suillus discolor]KAG2105541.1 hypothetical protein F5147DRAFT_242924 [Suillus discolor]
MRAPNPHILPFPSFFTLSICWFDLYQDRFCTTHTPSTMSPVSARFRLLHTTIISSQAIILAFGYAFLGTVLYYDYLSLPHQVSNLWSHYPGELTMIVTLIATVLSVTTATSVYPFTPCSFPFTQG